MKIKGKEITLKANLRAMFAFEQITGKAFNLSTLTDVYIYFYCVVIVNNDLDLTFEEFVAILEDDESLFLEFKEYLTNRQKIDEQFAEDKAEDDGKKKG